MSQKITFEQELHDRRIELSALDAGFQALGVADYRRNVLLGLYEAILRIRYQAQKSPEIVKQPAYGRILSHAFDSYLGVLNYDFRRSQPTLAGWRQAGQQMLRQVQLANHQNARS